jgi:hypothetical protein
MNNKKCNERGKKLAKKLFNEIVQIMHEFDGVHMQVGKVYPYMLNRGKFNIDLLKLIKNKVDPYNLINPGALGL